MQRLIICAAVILGVLSQQPPIDENFVTGNRQFAADVYKELLKSEKGNFLVSPLSVETVLALALEGSNGETSEELIKGLKFPGNRQNVSESFRSLLPQFKTNTEDLQLLSANKIYVNQNFSVRPNFEGIAKDGYLSDAENIAFTEPVKAASSINSWVEAQTAGKIKDLVPPEALSPSIQIVLVNTLYFKGKWNLFDNIDTRTDTFYATSGTIQVPTMYTTENLNFYENKDLKAKFLELPYLGGDVVLTIVLPIQKGRIADLETKLDEVLKPQPFNLERVYVAIPKFSIESKVKFVPILQNLGVKKAFIGGEADFSGIGGKKGDLYISDVLQKTFINVTESGTEAASSTAGLVALLSAPFQPRITANFVADNPYIFYIKHITSETILFVGRFTG